MIAYSGPTNHIVDIFPEQYATEKACNYARLVGKYEYCHPTKPYASPPRTHAIMGAARNRIQCCDEIKRYARLSKGSHALLRLRKRCKMIYNSTWI